ncbi:unnamed protein product [Rhizoctonia solani]|uniref:CHAT domain-containing protein n=1 Tax=Rhizoctonia solani TaxID=456999 RepID=A0A8H3I0E4_9AGAM|nr:unnamed protein product [Rhizoctonia solani]
MDDIEKGIEFNFTAISMVPDGHPDLPEFLSRLSVSHKDRFEHLGQLGDVEKIIEYDTRAIAATPKDDPELPEMLGKLGKSHICHFYLSDEPNDLAKAIECQSYALGITSDNSPYLPTILGNLGATYTIQYNHLGDLDDLAKATEYMCRGLALAPDDHPDLPNLLTNLGVVHTHRFKCLGEPEDLDKTIEYESRALELTLDGYPDLANCLVNLAGSHAYRFERLYELHDLEKAIEYESRALTLTPDANPALLNRLVNLELYHMHRFERLGTLSDLEGAIQYGARALALTPDGHQDLPKRLASRGESYAHRFERLGVLDDLEMAIEHQARALTMTPDGHQDLPTHLANLGISYAYRFQRLGDLDDLGKAIQYESQALELTPDGHSDLPNRLANLAGFHMHRFERLGELNGVEKAVEYQSRALELTPDGHPDLPGCLVNLGVAYAQRLKPLEELDDLAKGIQYQSRALALTPNGHPDLPNRLGNLATSHKQLFRHLGDLDELKKAIEYEARALAAIPVDHPHSCRWHFNHALSYIDYYKYTNNSVHLTEALHFIRITNTSPAGSPREKFNYAHQWATLASYITGICPIEAYQTTIDLLPQFIWLGATTDQRYEDLRMVETLAVNAAHSAILSMDYPLALEWLEQTRCIVSNQNLILRSPLDQLQASHPSLAIRLQTVTGELHSVSSESRESRVISSRSITAEEAGLRHRRLATEYQNLLTQVRVLPDFEGFLQPIKANGLVRAARNGPVVIINCHANRCDALLVVPGQDNITHLPLPSFSRGKALYARSKIESSLRRLGLRERGVHTLQESGFKDEFAGALKSIWDGIVKPVLDWLGYTGNGPSRDLPHITWCPTGPVSFLPLHAAGDYDQPASTIGSRIFDFVVSSYTPTITALLATTPSKLSNESRVLAIGQAATPGHTSLPGTSLELGYVKSHVESKVGYSQLTDAQATPSAVLDAMEKHDWVHLACHAHQNIKDPTKSGFFLHGETEGTEATLDLAAINRRLFKSKGLAFLSACQTATGDVTLPDEAVHLASGMLMAGYSSVIASMWSVVDEDAPFVADKVYSQLMKEGKLGNGEAGKALHDAVAGLREKVGEKEFGRRVPYIHIGS